MSGTNHGFSLPDHELARRRLLAGGIGVAAAAVLGGCGDEGTAPQSESPSESESESPSASGTELGPAADVAVGGGAIYDVDEPVVVTQPSEGQFRAFNAICTHAGCVVASVTDTINCDCHGSKFSLEDGSVVNGPATKPLAAKDVSVDGGTVTVA